MNEKWNADKARIINLENEVSRLQKLIENINSKESNESNELIKINHNLILQLVKSRDHDSGIICSLRTSLDALTEQTERSLDIAKRALENSKENKRK